MKFFGHQVSETGCEMLIKVGSRWADPKNAGHLISWRDGQIIEITPLGFHNGTQVGYHSVLLRFPNIDYATLGGRWQDAWKKMPAEATLWDKVNCTINKDGKYPWEVMQGSEFTSVRKTRDYFIDFKALELASLITTSEKESIYNPEQKSIVTISSSFNPETLVKHEEVDTRLDPSKLLQPASIASGTYAIGSGLAYATIAAFEADIAAQLTGNLTGEQNDEETAIASAITFDLDTNTHLLKLTAQSGDEHNGGAYGNGARINYGTWDSIAFNETTNGHLDHVEISNLALDASGTQNYGLLVTDGGNAGFLFVDKMLIKGDGNSFSGIVTGGNALNTLYTNNIIYDFSQANYIGLMLNALHYGTYNTQKAFNNTIIGCGIGIKQENSTYNANYTIELKNNLCQNNTTDYVDDGSGFGTHSKNISEDATSPDVAYRSKDLHTNSVFKDYAADDFRLDSGGDATNLAIVDDGDDLSGTFTDDIEGQTRSTWYIGASEIVAAGGTTYYQNIGQGAVAPTGILSKKTTPVTTMGGHAISITGLLTKSIVIGQTTGGHAMAITGTLTAVVTFIRTIGGYAMTITGILVKKTSKSVGDGQILPTGILNKKTSKDVGDGSVTSIGILTTAIMYMQAVGGASMGILGSLATQFIEGTGIAKFIRRRKTFYKQ